MTRSERTAYQDELRRVARRLGLGRAGNLEDKISEYCLRQVGDFVQGDLLSRNLEELRDLVATALDVELVRIHNQDDVIRLRSHNPPGVMWNVETDLRPDVDGFLLQRGVDRKPWDRHFLAVSNCMTRHPARAYFTEWHELVHVLLGGRQLQFAYRRIPSEKKDPEEVLVDPVAGVLAFYPPIFQPALRDEMRRAGRLTLAGIESVRQRLAPGASRQAVTMAAVRHCAHVAFYLYATPGRKRAEQEVLDSGQRNLFGETHAPQLRVKEVVTNQDNIRLHINMRVPEESIVYRAFAGEPGCRHEGSEDLSLWTTAQSGPIGRMQVHVEATREGDGVVALLTELVT